jgi:undecaprenyl-diphosphatase
MIKSLIELDQQLFLKINHWSGPGWDPVMRFISGPLPWVAFIVVAAILISRLGFAGKKLRELNIIILVLIIAWAVSDLGSVHLFKNVFERLRPCHEPSLAGQVRLAASTCGGQFGFVSTHASNSFTLAILSVLIFRLPWFTWAALLWALLISYSRIYLGVHYPGDVLGGALLGLLIATFSFLLYTLLLKKTTPRQKY